MSGTIFGHKWDIGNGLKFDGVNDYVNIPNMPFDFTPLASSFTISSIIYYKTSTKDFEMFYKALLGTDREVEFRINANGSVLCNQSNENISPPKICQRIISTITLIPENFYNCIFVKVGSNANDWQLYLNGILSSKSVPYNDNVLSTHITTAKINFDGEADYSNSAIYDLKIFNKALTQSEVTELYLKQGQIVPASAISSLQLDMRFNNKSGTIAKDQSTNGYNGTLVNYAAGTTDIGATNMWKDKYGASILAY